MLKRLHQETRRASLDNAEPPSSRKSRSSSIQGTHAEEMPDDAPVTGKKLSCVIDDYIEVMPDQDRAILAGRLYKLTSGHASKWEQREMILSEDRLSYGIDSNASRAWNALGLRVAESIPLLDIEKVVSDADNKMGCLYAWSWCWEHINHDRATDKSSHQSSKSRVKSNEPRSGHMGVIKKRGQFNTAFKSRFLVLIDDMLEYYEDEKAYFAKKEDGLKGSIPTRHVIVTPATQSGADKTNDGYHFTIENTSNGKLIECACEDAESRDMWVQKIQTSYHHATVQSDEMVTFALHIKPEGGHDIGRVHYFHAENEQECLTWTKALQEAVVNARKRQLAKSISAWRRMQIKLRSIYNSDPVQFTVVIVIIANFVANIVEFELMSADPAEMEKFDTADLAFTILFTLELIANMIAHLDMLPFPFLSDSWNILDMVIVIISLVSISVYHGNSGVKAIRTMRAFRIVRVFKRLAALRSMVKVDFLLKNIHLSCLKFARRLTFENALQGLVAIVKPVLNTFFVMLVATAVYAVLGVGLFGERPGATKYFGHFSEAFFTMFQCVSGDGWASGVARPMFESAETTCTYRDEETGKCVFDIGVAIFFVSYILIVVTVILNVVLAVLLDEFLKAQDQDEREKALEKQLDDVLARQFFNPLDPFLKHLSEFHNSDEMAMRIQQAFDAFDYNKNGVIDFLEVKVGLERLNLCPKIKLLEEDWRDITNHGELCGDDYTLTSQQFFEVMRNQVTLYAQRVASKAQAQEQKPNGMEDEQSTTFLLKYLVTAIDDLRSTVISLQDPPCTASVCRGRGRGGGRKDKFLPRCAYSSKHKRRHGLRGESASHQEPIMAEAEKVLFGPDEGYFSATRDVEDYTGKGACLQAGEIHVERERDGKHDRRHETTGDINISSAPELADRQLEVNSTCEPNTGLTDLKTGQSQRPRNQMHHTIRVLPDMTTRGVTPSEAHSMSGGEVRLQSPERDENHMHLKVKGLHGNFTVFKIKKTTSLKKVIENYCMREGLEMDRICFLLNGDRVCETQMLAELNMLDEDMMEACYMKAEKEREDPNESTLMPSPCESQVTAPRSNQRTSLHSRAPDVPDHAHLMPSPYEPTVHRDHFTSLQALPSDAPDHIKECIHAKEKTLLGSATTGGQEGSRGEREGGGIQSFLIANPVGAPASIPTSQVPWDRNYVERNLNSENSQDGFSKSQDEMSNDGYC